MPKEGFKQLYEELPGDKLPFEEVWRLTGGNPRMLGRLYRVNWSVDRAVKLLIKEKDLRSFITSLRPGEVEALREAVVRVWGEAMRRFATSIGLKFAGLLCTYCGTTID